jgi:hypothetical protein
VSDPKVHQKQRLAALSHAVGIQLRDLDSQLAPEVLCIGFFAFDLVCPVSLLAI